MINSKILILAFSLFFGSVFDVVSVDWPQLKSVQPLEDLGEILANPRKREELLKRLDCPELQSQAQVFEHLDFCMRLAEQLDHFGELGEDDKKTYSDISWVAKHWKEFYDPFDQQKSHFFIKDNLYVKLPNNLKLIDNAPSEREIKVAIERGYREMSKSFAKANLRFPKGFLFIWVFSDITSMRRYWPASQEAGALTLGCRQVLIPSYPSIQRETSGSSSLFPFEDILAHELVHVWVNSQLDYAHIDDIPKWFHEGLATYFVSKWTKYAARTITTAQYEEYFQYFNYIDQKYGSEKLFNFVKESLFARDVSAGLRSILQIPSESALQVRVFAWTNRPSFEPPLVSIIAIAAGFAIFIAVGYRIWIQRNMLGQLISHHKNLALELAQEGNLLEAAKIYERLLIDFPKYRGANELKSELSQLMPPVKVQIQSRVDELLAELRSIKPFPDDSALAQLAQLAQLTPLSQPHSVALGYYLDEAKIWLQDAIKYDKISAKLNALDKYLKFLNRSYLLKAHFSEQQIQDARNRVEELMSSL